MCSSDLVLVAVMVHQVQLVHQSARLEKLERAVNGDAVQLGIFLTRERVQALGIQVLAGLIDQIEQDLALAREPHAFFFERIFDAGNCHERSLEASYERNKDRPRPGVLFMTRWCARRVYCYYMYVGNIEFAWDPGKAGANLVRVFDSPNLGEARHTARRDSLLELSVRKEYDFSQSRKNPYAKQVKRPVTIRLDTTVVAYFKQLAEELVCPTKTSSTCS